MNHDDISPSAPSDEVRRMLLSGDVAGASRLLGTPYMLSGVVVGGKRIGKKIGFPTANLRLRHPSNIVPLQGVYATLAYLGDDGRAMPAMTNIGFRPTFDGDGMTIETHIFGLDRDIYGVSLTVAFIERIRPEQRFADIAELVGQLHNDARHCYNIIKVYGARVGIELLAEGDEL